MRVLWVPAITARPESLRYLATSRGAVRTFMRSKLTARGAPSAVALTPDGKSAYVTNFGANTVSQYDNGYDSARQPLERRDPDRHLLAESLLTRFSDEAPRGVPRWQRSAWLRSPPRRARPRDRR